MDSKVALAKAITAIAVAAIAAMATTSRTEAAARTAVVATTRATTPNSPETRIRCKEAATMVAIRVTMVILGRQVTTQVVES